jgi:hypothetical protein
MVATVTSTPTPTTTITTVHTQTQQNGNGAANGTPRRADTNNQEKEQEVEEEEDKTRVWAIWTRNYGTDAASNPAKNTLYILRLVIDPPSSPSFSPSSPDLQLAFDAVLHSALDTARAWNCGAVHLWNPTPIARDLISRSGVTHSYVHRDVDSIPSMMWYGPEGEGRENDGEGKGAVDWIANEKYCWC